jgi:hypothetical protein
MPPWLPVPQTQTGTPPRIARAWRHTVGVDCVCIHRPMGSLNAQLQNEHIWSLWTWYNTAFVPPDDNRHLLLTLFLQSESISLQNIFFESLPAEFFINSFQSYKLVLCNA